MEDTASRLGSFLAGASSRRKFLRGMGGLAAGIGLALHGVTPASASNCSCNDGFCGSCITGPPGYGACYSPYGQCSGCPSGAGCPSNCCTRGSWSCCASCCRQTCTECCCSGNACRCFYTSTSSCGGCNCGFSASAAST